MLRERRRHASFKPNRKYELRDLREKRLDRKSSRGMIYENEELRLRTININAEVERGQSDIKKLRRENDQLRKEIWSLRDEYDRLDKLLRAHKTSAANKKARRGEDYDDEDEDDDDDDDEEDDEDEADDDKCNSCNQSEDSCDSCNDDDNATDEANENQQNARLTRSGSGSSKRHHRHHHRHQPKAHEQQLRDKLHVNFDHLSIVSEETAPSYSDEDNATMEYNKSYRPKSPLAGDRSPAVLCDFQSIVPSLAHFENLCYDKIGPSIDDSGNLQYPDEYSPGPTTSSTGDTVIPAIGWDFSKLPLSTNNTSLHSAKPSTISKQSDRGGGPPDICIQNVWTSEPSAGTPKNSRTCTPSLFPTGGNLDDLLLDIEHLTKDLTQMQIDNTRKKQPKDLDESANDDWGNSSKPPYRSEMNLVLSFDGTNNTITSVTAVEEPILLTADPSNSSTPPPPPNTPSLNLSHQDSPPPVIPAPMVLLPVTLPYVEFQDTRQVVPDPPTISAQTGSNLGRMSSNFATIRRKFFTRKSSVSNDSTAAKTVSEVTSSSSDAGALVVPPNEEAAHDTSEKPTTSNESTVPSSVKRKSRRVSIDFNNGNIRKSTKDADGRRGSTASCIDMGDAAPGKANGNHKKSTSLSRKMSQGSNRPSRPKKKPSGRRHSDVGIGGAATDGSERTSNSVASSRESSTSVSTRSQKSARKISIGSHGTGTGSIPWCACWGNGCI